MNSAQLDAILTEIVDQATPIVLFSQGVWLEMFELDVPAAALKMAQVGWYL